MDDPLPNQASQHPEEAAETQISGSDSVWDSQLEMVTITGKLTRPDDYKPKSVIEAEKKQKDKLEK